MQGDGPMEEADYRAECDAEAEAEGEAMAGMAAEAEHEATELNKVNLASWQIRQSELTMFKENLRTKKDEILEKFEEDNGALMKRIEELSCELDSDKEQFKLQAIQLFEKTKEKKLIGGIGIREGTELVYNSLEALKWAIDHNLALTLDRKRFEQLAKTESIDFVKKETKITVTFPKEIKFTTEKLEE